MKILKQLLLAALVAGTAQLASALPYNASDLLLVFRQSGFNDVEFNLGPVGNYLDQPAGVPLAVSYDTNLVATNFGGAFAGVKFAAVAATPSGASQPRVWLSDANLVTTPTDFTVSKFSVVRGKVDAVGVQNGAITGAGNVPLVISPTAVGSYSYIVSPGNTTAIGTFGGDVPLTVEALNGGSLAFYQVVASGVTPKPAAIKIGTFAFAVDGGIAFTPVATTPVLTSASLSAQAATLNAGASKTFSVTADGACGYQWYLNGSAIGGATSSSYSIASPVAADAGAYTVVASNCVYGTTVTSTAAQLDIISVPTITMQPAAQSVARAAAATLTVTVNNGFSGTGTPPTLSYQWYLNGVVISGATSSSYNIPAAGFADLGNYSVTVSNPAGTATSSNALLRFTSGTAYLGGDLQLIFRQSGFSDVEFNLGTVSNYLNRAASTVIPVNFNTNTVFTNFSSSLTGVKFAVAAANSSTLWLSDANLSTVPTDPTVSKFSVQRGKIDNAGVQAAAITLGVNPLVISPSAVSSWSAIVSPGNSSAIGTLGGDAVFAVEAVNGNSLALYQVVPSAANPKPAAIKIGTFAYAADGTVTFTSVATTPVLTSASLAMQAATLNAGASKTFSVTADGACGYQWYLNGSAIGGATSSSLALVNLTGANAGSYTVVASNCVYGTTATSAAALLTVVPVISTQPVSLTNNAGTMAVLNVVGSGAAAYQWYNGVTAVAGATAATLTLNNVLAADAGDYTVVLSNSTATTTSSVATLTVIDPYINTQPVSTAVKVGVNATFSVAATGTGLAYQWLQNGTNALFPSAHSATLTVTNPATKLNGFAYAVVVSNSLGQSVTSATASLGVTASGVPITISKQPVSLTKFAGQSATFSVVATGAAPFTSLNYQWTVNGTNIAGATGTDYTISATSTNDAGNYAVTIANTVGYTNSSAATLTVNMEAVAPTAVVIVSPKTKFETNGSTVLVTGTAKDAAGLSQIRLLVGTNVFTSANVTNGALVAGSVSSGWAGSATLSPGTNLVYAVAVNLGGLSMTSAPVALFYQVPSAFTVSTNTSGGGTIAIKPVELAAGNYYIGRTYAFTAKPDKNSLLSNIVNAATSGTTTVANTTPLKGLKNVSVLAEVANTVTINFVTNRFIGAEGNYCGLFTAPTVAKENAGFFTVKVTSKLVVSGSLTLNGVITPFSGALNMDGVSTTKSNTVLTATPVGGTPLALNFQLGFDGTIGGTISNDTNWVAAVDGDQAVFSATAPTTSYNGNYTMVIPGTPGQTNAPAGDGYATISVSSAGVVKAVGALGDGDKFTPVSTTVSEGGRWPLFSMQYNKTGGIVIGWVNFTNNTANSTLTATNLYWLKQVGAGVNYQAGFTNAGFTADASVLTASPTLAFIAGNTATMTFADGNLVSPINNAVTVGAANAITTTTNGLAKSFKITSSGLVTGQFGSGLTKVAGVYLQSTNYQYVGGFFLGTNQSGRLLIK